MGGNEAGILIDGEARGADAAVWLREALPPRTGRFRTVPPILASKLRASMKTRQTFAGRHSGTSPKGADEGRANASREER